jgi:hypothetical protein
MTLSGFITDINIRRETISGHEPDGTPMKVSEQVWFGKGHYQQQQGTFQGTDVGYLEYQVYRFWLPFLTSPYRPMQGDVLFADGYNYAFIGIEQESNRHHLIVKAQRVER